MASSYCRYFSERGDEALDRAAFSRVPCSHFEEFKGLKRLRLVFLLDSHLRSTINFAKK
jgi:hypothetical protein